MKEFKKKKNQPLFYRVLFTLFDRSTWLISSVVPTGNTFSCSPQNIKIAVSFSSSHLPHNENSHVKIIFFFNWNQAEKEREKTDIFAGSFLNSAESESVDFLNNEYKTQDTLSSLLLFRIWVLLEPIIETALEFFACKQEAFAGG